MATIVAEIETERAHQDEQWGGLEHDQGHSGNDWVAYIAKQCRSAGRAWNAHVSNGKPEDKAEYKQRMVKVAALAVAAIEARE